MSPGRIAEQDEYDYIVCGGGTSGCVVAARLAEDENVSVLLIEAGKDGKDNENIKMVGGWSKNFDADTDWNLETPPMKSIDGRKVKLSRGKFLGGSSGVNGTLVVRGCKQDFDDWDLPGWSGEEMFEYMKKSENFHPKPWFPHDPSAHGTSGPLHTEPFDMAPISNLMLDSMVSSGLPLHPDMFSTGETPHGCGHAVRTHHKGLRSIGADFVTGDYEKGNITVLCEMLVDRVVLERDGDELRATGVEVVGIQGGEKRTLKAKREVVLSAGAYCSPVILMRSGIGAKDELEQHQIECLVDLPGVGKNLLDHLIVFTFYEVNRDGLTNDYQVYHHPDAAMAAYMLYKEQKTGILSTFPFGAFAFARLDSRLQDSELWQKAARAPGRDPMGLTDKQPHVEYFTTELYGGPKQYDQFPIDKKHAFAMITELFSPRSKGSVALKSADPVENPQVDCNYLADPLDMLVMAEGVRFGNEIVIKGKGTKDVVKGSYPDNLTHHAFTERDEWIPHVRQHATTCYHAAGTCKMGKDDDSTAVLDEKLNVRGVRGLRVADCSVMPTLHGGHTQMPAYGIGEKAADLIKAAVASTS